MGSDLNRWITHYLIAEPIAETNGTRARHGRKYGDFAGFASGRGRTTPVNTATRRVEQVLARRALGRVFAGYDAGRLGNRLAGNDAGALSQRAPDLPTPYRKALDFLD
jgi:hypothetical protein